MRHEDFNIETLLDAIDLNYLEVDEALNKFYPGMTAEDFTYEETEELERETARCDNCKKLAREFSFSYNDIFRGDLCDDCYQEYGEEDEEYISEDELEEDEE